MLRNRFFQKKMKLAWISFTHALKTMPKYGWALLAIIVLGIFLRAYHFHQWLNIGLDQVKDAQRVETVLEGKEPWPQYGPEMSNSGTGGRSKRFRLGPMYYYFEIASAGIFGNRPDSMAYPDLFFSILSIPLFFVFMNRYFSRQISLMLTGLYTISFFSLFFSHAAWNPNSIPFFTLLYLLSLLEFLERRNDTRWIWAISLGIALGVAVQLHAILLVLFPAVAVLAFAYLLKKDPRVWKKILAVFFCVIVLNLGQVRGEISNDFKNTKIFLNSLSKSSRTGLGGQGTMPQNFADDVSCNIEANFYMLTAIGSDECDFSFARIVGASVKDSDFKKLFTLPQISRMLAMLVFSAFGYGLLVFRFRREKNPRKKYFLGLVMLFSLLSFLVVLPIIDAAVRYLMHLTFLPYIFLGILLEILSRKWPKIYSYIAILLFLSIAATNAYALNSLFKNPHIEGRIYLGEMEEMMGYMAGKSRSSRKVYLSTVTKFRRYFNSLDYIANRQGVDLVRTKENTNVPAGAPLFLLGSTTTRNPKTNFGGHHYKIKNQKKFNDLVIYELEN
ncbi:MAG: glycosyltransferase family 39 protein [Candidatus Moranbacteria bacterium]|nr:glycosyltransferase family 39 protein [Candidatus Moranbacteria bacterium]